MGKALSEMVTALKNNFNIDFYDYDTENSTLDNVTFSYKGRLYKICKYHFYREGGMCKILKLIQNKDKKEYATPVDLTDEMFYELTKLHILKSFGLEGNIYEKKH